MRAKPFVVPSKSRQMSSLPLLTDEQNAKIDAELERSWQSTIKGRKPPTVDVMAANLEKLQHLAPRKFVAFDLLIESAVRQEKAEVAAARGVRGRLLSRLQQQHDCRQPETDRGFEQLPPIGKQRRWKCLFCGLEVTLD